MRMRILTSYIFKHFINLNLFIKNIYYKFAWFVLFHPHLFIFLSTLLMSFLLNSLTVEAAVLRREMPFYETLIKDITNDFNQKERAPDNLPFIELSPYQIMNILIVSDNPQDVITNTTQSLKLKAYKADYNHIFSYFTWFDSLTPKEQCVFLAGVIVLIVLVGVWANSTLPTVQGCARPPVIENATT